MARRNERLTPWIATHPGEIIKDELDERGISQKAFAEMLGMQKSYICELLKGKRPMTMNVAEKIENSLGVSAVVLVNMQTQYEYDIKAIELRGIEEQKAANELKLYNEIFDVATMIKRVGVKVITAVQKLAVLKTRALLPPPAELQLKASGMFRKSAKTGQDPRMLMTWKLIAEVEARKCKVDNKFDFGKKDEMVRELVATLHKNTNVEANVKRILAANGIAFCVVKKVDKASVDGYSFVENGVPHIVLTKRYDRIDNFAFDLMHEVGHVLCHYIDGENTYNAISIPNYDHESKEEREANTFAANALIPSDVWNKAPKSKVNIYNIQRTYTEWAKQNNLNKWIVLGRIAYETGMYKFANDSSRKIG